MRPSHAPSRSRSLSNWILLFLLLLTATGSAQTPWVQSHRLGNEVRFLYFNLIQRYDLTSRSWLPDITLPRSGATAFTGDDTGNVVAYGTSLFRYSPSWSGESSAGTLASSADRVFVDGNLIIATHSVGPSGRVTTLNRSTATIIEYKRVEGEPIYGASLAPRINRIFGRTSGVATPDLVAAGYSDSGSVSGPANSPYSGTYPNATRAFVFPDDRRVVDSSGSVYSTGSMTYLGSLGPIVTDIAWNGDIPIVLAGNTLFACNPTLELAGRITLATSGVSLAVTASDAFIFRPAPSYPSVEIIPLNALSAPNQGNGSLDLAGTTFSVDDSFIDTGNIIHLVNNPNGAVVRWSPTTRSFLPTLMLPQEPASITYSSGLNRLYFVNHSELNSIRSIDLSLPVLADSLFAVLPNSAEGFTSAGSLLHSSTTFGAVLVHSSSGSLLNNTNVPHRGKSRTWDPVRRRMYRFRENTVPRDLLYEVITPEGRLGDIIESPYNGDFAFVPPILVSPDGNRIVIGSGVVFNATGLSRITTLPISPADGIWSGTSFYSIQNSASATVVQSWNASSYAGGTIVAQLKGTPIRIFSLPSGYAVITSVNGSPQINLLNLSFNVLYQSPLKPLPPSAPSIRARSAVGISLNWLDQSDNEDSFLIEFRIANSNSPWSKGIETPSGTTSGTQPDLLPDQTYEFRIRAITQSLSSPPSPTVSARTLSSPDEPIGEPYQLSVTRIYATSLTISWSDNATNETGFRILRSLSPDGPATSFSVPADVTSFTDTGLPTGSLIYYRIQSFNGGISGELSAQFAVPTRSSDAPPTAPAGFSITDVTSTSARLSWSDTSLNEDSFDIDRSSNPVTSWSTVATRGSNSSSIVLTDLTPFTAYSFRVRATNPSGSTSSAIVTITTPRVGGEFLNLAMRHNNIYYFALNAPNRIERYDLAATSWLPPVPLNAQATALWIDSSGIYVAEGRDIVRWNLDGSARTLLRQMASTAADLFATNSFVLVRLSPQGWTSLTKSTGAISRSFNTSFAFHFASVGVSFDPLLQRAFFSTSHSSVASAISFFELSSVGALAREGVSPNEGPRPRSSRTFVFPSGGRVADDSGSIYSTDSALYLGSLGAPFTDLAFLGSNIPIILRNNRLHALSSTFTETGSLPLSSQESVRVAVQGNSALVFSRNSLSSNGLAVESLPLASLPADTPDLPLDPRDLLFSPDDAFTSNNGTIHILSRRLLSLFRWSPETRNFLTPIPLLGVPNRISYSPANNRIYIAYATGTIRQIDLSATSPSELPFASVDFAPITGLTAASGFVHANTLTGYTTFSPSGTTVTASTSAPTSAENTWDPVRSRIYHLTDTRTPIELASRTFSPSGLAQTFLQSSTADGFQFATPIRVHSDGTRIALASGQIFSATSLTLASTLTTSVTDLIWNGDDIASIRPLNGATQLQRWSGPLLNLHPASRTFSGSPVRLLKTSSGFVVITQINGSPRLALTDADFNPVHISSPATPPPVSLTTTSRSDSSISLSWLDAAENSSAFSILYRIAASSDPWTEAPRVSAPATQSSITGLNPGTSYEFRIFTLTGDISSPTPASITASTLSSTDQPIGEPYNLALSRTSRSSLTITWQDNATNESGFLLYRSRFASEAPTIIPLPPNTTSFIDSNIAGFASFFYRIQAVNGPVAGDLSAQLAAPVNLSTSPPPAPKNLAADVSTQRVFLTWRDNSTDEDNFTIERLVNGFWQPLRTLPFNTTSTTVDNLETAVTHTLRIRASNLFGNSFSNSIAVTPPAIGGSFLDLASESAGIHYFAFSNPSRIERFHLASRLWLPPILTQLPVNALCVDDAAIYAAENRVVVRWNLDGSNRQILASSTFRINSLFSIGNLLGIHDGSLRTVHRLTGDPMATVPPTPDFAGPSVSPRSNRLFFRSPSNSAGRVHSLDFAPDGSISSSNSSQPFGFVPLAPITWTFPDGSRIIDESGNIYLAQNLLRINSLFSANDTSPVTHATFSSHDAPIILRSNLLTAYRFASIPTGSVTVPSSRPKRVSVHGTDALVFSADGRTPNGMQVDTFPLSALNAPTPSQPSNPSGLPFNPTDAFIDRDSTLHILSRSHLSLFRWSPAQNTYTGTLSFPDAPSSIAYHPDANQLYFATADRDIFQLNLGNPATPPSPFASTDSPVDKITLTTNLLIAAHGTPSAASLSTFSLSGNQLASSSGFPLPSHLTWEPANRQFYALQTQTPASLLAHSINPDGTFGPRRSAPAASLTDPAGPIRARHDGSLLILGSGSLLRSSDLSSIRDIGIRPADMLWLGNNLITLENDSPNFTRVQRWSTSWLREKAVILAGNPWRILPLPDGRLIVITTVPDSAPRIHLLSPSLDQLSDSESSPLSIVRQPLPQLRVPFGSEAIIETFVIGTPPISYQWFRNNIAIPGATGSQLRIPNAGSLAAGTYKVRVSNATTDNISSNSSLIVGPVSPSPIDSRSLLLSGAGSLREFPDPLNSPARRAFFVPAAPGTSPLSAYPRIAGAIADRLGRLHTLNHAHGGTSSQVFITTHDPGFNSWLHRPLPGIRTSSPWREGDLCLSGDWAVMNRGLFHTVTSEWRPFSPEWLPSRVATSPDGDIFGISTTGVIRQFLPASDAWGPPLSLQLPATCDAFAVGTQNTFFVFSQGAYRSFSPDGSPIRSLPPSSPLNPQNLAIGGPGNFQLAAGSADSATFSVTQSGLLSDSRVSSTNTTAFPGFFVSWIPPLQEVLPDFVRIPPPPATDRIPWSWKPEITHPDPDAIVVVEALSIPPWMSFSNGTLSGTPTDPISPTAVIYLSARDGLGRQSLWSTSVSVINVNDPPVIPAAIPNISASDAAADQLVTFAPFASDPDAGDSLTWRITANSNPALFSSLSFDPQGRLSIRYAPYLSGSATITVSVTDSSSASAQRSFNITVPPLPAPAITSQNTPSLNPLTGLWELPVTIRNIAQRAIGGFSLSASSLPQGTSLYNASNAVSTNPVITDARPLNPNQSITLTLEFLHPSQNPLPAPTLTSTTALPRPALSTPFAIDRASFLSPESLLLEFPSEPGVLYQIQYSHDGTDWLDSLSRLRAAGTSTQWIDSGSPRTTSPPGPGSRFYRVKRLAGS